MSLGGATPGTTAPGEAPPRSRGPRLVLIKYAYLYLLITWTTKARSSAALQEEGVQAAQRGPRDTALALPPDCRTRVVFLSARPGRTRRRGAADAEAPDRQRRHLLCHLRSAGTRHPNDTPEDARRLFSHRSRHSSRDESPRKPKAPTTGAQCPASIIAEPSRESASSSRG